MFLVRRLVAHVTAVCLLTTQTLAIAGPHEEGVAAGQAANPVARGSISSLSAAEAIPGYTTAPPELGYYREPSLTTKSWARLAACALTPADPVCQAQQGAVTSANTPRPAVAANDPAVAAARAIGRTPSLELGSLAAFYGGCATTANILPARVQQRSCLRQSGSASLSCSRTLSVSTARSSTCNPGDWYARAASGGTSLDVQCLPDRVVTAQHFRVTQDGVPRAFFDVDMTTPVVFPQMVSVVDTTYSPLTGLPNRIGVWVGAKECSGAACSLTAMVAPERVETCIFAGRRELRLLHRGNVHTDPRCVPRRHAARRPNPGDGLPGGVRLHDPLT